MAGDMIFGQQKRRAYFIGGVSGVGKSTFLSHLVKTTYKFEVVYGSRYFMKWLGIKEGDYDTLQSMPNYVKNKELDKMMRHLLLKRQNNKNNKTLLIDAHYLRIHEGNISDSTGEWLRLFDGFFVLNDKPEIILKRIDSDQLNYKKIRKIFPSNITDNNEKIKLLAYYLNKTTEKVKESSIKFNIPYFIIQNKHGKIKEIINEFVTHIETIENNHIKP